MNPQEKTKIKSKNNITRTGYRALFLLLKLIENPLSREEIIELLKKDPIINKNLSKDTVTYTINTLKKSGCIISRPSQKTNNKYVLKYHPIDIKLTEEHVQALQTFRDNIISLGDWELLIYLNNLYAKFAQIAPNEEIKNKLLYNQPLANIDYDIINKLIFHIKTVRKAKLVYNSPQNGLESFEFTPEYITLENSKLYVWGYNYKYEIFGYLRIDKIKKVITKLNSTQTPYSQTHLGEKIIYKLKGYSALMYSMNEYESIEQHNHLGEYPLTIKAHVNNKFNFYQRILEYGTDCIIVKPDSAKQEFLKILKSIKSGYKNEQ